MQHYGDIVFATLEPVRGVDHDLVRKPAESGLDRRDLVTVSGTDGCEVAATRFVQTWPIRLTQLSAFALLAIGYGVYALGMVPAFLILGTLIWTMSEIVGAPTVWSYPGVVAPAHLRGRYFGAMQSMYGLGSTLGPILGVALFEHVGQRFFLWAAGVAVVAVVATVVGRIGMRGPEPTPEPEPATESPLPQPAT
jgi:MFS family permease